MLNCAEHKREKNGFPHGWVYVRKSKLFTGDLAETQSLGWRLCKNSPQEEMVVVSRPSGEGGNLQRCFYVELLQSFKDPFWGKWQPLPELFLSGKKKNENEKKIFSREKDSEMGLPFPPKWVRHILW